VHFSWLGPLNLEAPPLDIPVGAVNLLHEDVELFLLLAEGGFTSKDVCLALVLVLLLAGGLLVPSAIVILWRCCHEASPLWCLVGVRASLGCGMARVVLEQVEDE
jgi:hypothetical protein